MAHRAVAIANELVRLPEARRNITQPKLQKLTYIAHGWSWAVNDEALLQDQVEARTYGPTYRDLYKHTKVFGKAPIDRLPTPDDIDPFLAYAAQHGFERSESCRAELSILERAVISHVWSRYRSLDGIMLSELTHQQGTPWFHTYTERGENSVIEDSDIGAHYEQLAERAAAKAA